MIFPAVPPNPIRGSIVAGSALSGSGKGVVDIGADALLRHDTRGVSQ
jgi:hypothetical protein